MAARLQALQRHFDVQGAAHAGTSANMAAAAQPAGGEVTLSTHVLDTSIGTPGRGMKLTLRSSEANGSWTVMSTHVTNDDGRVQGIPKLRAGVYSIIFHVEEYYAARQTECFYPDVTISFKTKGGHYHVPLLISPWGFSSYRGS